MAIINCLFSPTFENPRNFQLGVYLQSLVLNHAANHSRDHSKVSLHAPHSSHLGLIRTRALSH